MGAVIVFQIDTREQTFSLVSSSSSSEFSLASSLLLANSFLEDEVELRRPLTFLSGLLRFLPRWSAKRTRLSRKLCRSMLRESSASSPTDSLLLPMVSPSSLCSVFEFI